MSEKDCVQKLLSPALARVPLWWGRTGRWTSGGAAGRHPWAGGGRAPVSCVSPRVQPPHAPWKGCRPMVPSAAAEGRAAPGAAGTQFSRPPPPLRGPWRCWGPKCQRADPAAQVALLERRSLVLSNSIPFFPLNITCIVLSLSVLRFSRGRELRLRRAHRADVAASRGQDAVWRGGSCACGRFRRRACSLPASGLATISLP